MPWRVLRGCFFIPLPPFRLLFPSPSPFPSAVVDLCVGFSSLGCTALSYNFPFSSVSIFNNFCFLFFVIMTNDIFFLYILRTSLVPTLSSPYLRYLHTDVTSLLRPLSPTSRIFDILFYHIAIPYQLCYLAQSNIDAPEYFLSLLLLHMLDHELCAFACNFFAVVFCLPLDCLFLVRLQVGMPVACALSWTRIPCSDYLLFSHLRAVQQTSLLLAFRKGTIFDARWAAYRTTYIQDYGINICCQCNIWPDVEPWNAIRLFARYEDLLAVSQSDSVGSE